MKLHLTAVLIGVLMDLCLGDPHFFWHPVRAIGWLIAKLEMVLRKLFPKTAKGERMAGCFMTAAVLCICGGIGGGVLYLCYGFSAAAGVAAESVLCYQMLALKSLKDESMKVYRCLEQGTLEEARKAVSMIVGRDTGGLTDAGVTKAAVETVAENTSDAVIAPLLFMGLFGGLGGLVYKAVNTMDSMVGYKNEKYFYFGWASARLDDLCNYIPARVSALLMIAVSFIFGMDGIGAARIYRRDRFCHKSPNSAHTEAVCAGALGIELAGSASYFGKIQEKPTIGDDLRPVEHRDIKRANWLLYGTAFLAFLILGAVWWVL